MFWRNLGSRIISDHYYGTLGQSSHHSRPFEWVHQRLRQWEFNNTDIGGYENTYVPLWKIGRCAVCRGVVVDRGNEMEEVASGTFICFFKGSSFNGHPLFLLSGFLRQCFNSWISLEITLDDVNINLLHMFTSLHTNHLFDEIRQYGLIL